MNILVHAEQKDVVNGTYTIQSGVTDIEYGALEKLEINEFIVNLGNEKINILDAELKAQKIGREHVLKYAKWKKLVTRVGKITKLNEFFYKIPNEVIINLPPTEKNLELVRNGLDNYLEFKRTSDLLDKPGNTNEYEIDEFDLVKISYIFGVFSKDEKESKEAGKYIEDLISKLGPDRVHKIFSEFDLDDNSNKKQIVDLLKIALENPGLAVKR
ncbi:MAG TPA: hypothetical protein PKY25_02335 [Bacilli bacterium]|nr:hypothetical protein [Bacilli bacterium]